MIKNNNIIIVGAGLCGSLLAIRLAQRGCKVLLLEKRSDLRKADISAGRSINLALSNRGLHALDLVGLKNQVEQLCIPMKGRLIHSKKGETIFSPYSGRSNEFINSVSREGLNSMLLNKAESYPNVTVRFNISCRHIDTNKAYVEAIDLIEDKEESFTADAIFGTDGAGSIVRKSMQNQSLENEFDCTQDFLVHGYKELTIPASKVGGYRLEKNALHIWPRGSFMLIALPNLDGSFTVTLFLAYKDNRWSFGNLTEEQSIVDFFHSEFKDAMEHMPDLLNDFKENPVGKLGTVKCYPWQLNSKTLLMGDAAHAIVPFYGQGMNASFEDVAVLDKLIDEGATSWEILFNRFQQQRKKDADAIADLAIDNYYEMRDHVAHPSFMQKRKLEMELESNFPDDYFSKYSMVTFKETIPYKEAMDRGRAQDKLLLKMCEDNPNIGQEPLHEILKILQEQLP